jgi:hypothetical protein
MPFGKYISNVTFTAYVHNIMSVSSPLYCLQVQVGPVITKGKCAVGGCSDWSMSGCSHLTLQMDLRGVDKCWHLILQYWFWSNTHMMMVCTSCHVLLVCMCAFEFLNFAHRLLFLYGRSLRGNQGGWEECVCVLCVCVWERERER